MDDLEKQEGTSYILCQALCFISNPSVNSNWIYSPEMLNSGRYWWYFIPCDLEIWWMTLEYSRAPLLYYIKLCASFQIHQWSQTWVTVRKDSGSKLVIFCFVWPWNLMNDLKKTIGHLFFTTFSFVHHFKAMGEFKLEFQSGNAQFGSKSAIFCPMWPWNLTDDNQ